MLTAKEAREQADTISKEYQKIRRKCALDEILSNIEEKSKIGYNKLDTMVHPDDEKYLKKELNKLGYRVVCGSVLFYVHWDKTWWQKIKEFFVKT